MIELLIAITVLAVVAIAALIIFTLRAEKVQRAVASDLRR